MGEQWYYAKDNQQQGPYSLEEVKDFAKAGEFGSSDLVWTDTMEDWTPASEVGEFEFPAAPTRFPPNLPPRPVASAERPSARQQWESLLHLPAMAWSLCIVAGAGLLFLAFFVPWWGIEIDRGKDASASERREANEVQERNAFWYLQHVRPVSKLDDADGVTLWGWNTGTGITGLVFVILLLPIAVLPLCFKLLRPWAWVGRFLAALAGCVMLVMFAVWFFGAPSKNASPILYQGLYLGPYLAFLAGGVLVLTGVAGGAMGLVAFITELDSESAGAGETPLKPSGGADDARLDLE